MTASVEDGTVSADAEMVALVPKPRTGLCCAKTKVKGEFCKNQATHVNGKTCKIAAHIVQATPEAYKAHEARCIDQNSRSSVAYTKQPSLFWRFTGRVSRRHFAHVKGSSDHNHTTCTCEHFTIESWLALCSMSAHKPSPPKDTPSPKMCAFVGCEREATLGAHVQKAKSKLNSASSWYLVPACTNCNKRDAAADSNLAHIGMMARIRSHTKPLKVVKGKVWRKNELLHGMMNIEALTKRITSKQEKLRSLKTKSKDKSKTSTSSKTPKQTTKQLQHEITRLREVLKFKPLRIRR